MTDQSGILKPITKVVQEHFKVILTADRSQVIVLHGPSEVMIMRWACITGMEELGMSACEDYVDQIVELNIDWSAEDMFDLFSIRKFKEMILDPLGFGEIDAGEAAVKLWEKQIRESA